MFLFTCLQLYCYECFLNVALLAVGSQTGVAVNPLFLVGTVFMGSHIAG